MVRWKLCQVAATILVLSALWNVWGFGRQIARSVPRESEDMVLLENKFRPIYFALIRNNYLEGNLGYATSRTLRGEPKTSEDDIRRARLQYVTIPLHLVDNMEPPFIIGDFAAGETPPELPPGIVEVEIYAPGNGLVLYKREPAP